MNHIGEAKKYFLLVLAILFICLLGPYVGLNILSSGSDIEPKDTPSNTSSRVNTTKSSPRRPATTTQAKSKFVKKDNNKPANEHGDDPPNSGRSTNLSDIEELLYEGTAGDGKNN